MVTEFPVVTTFVGLLAAENGARPAIQQLDPDARVAVVMALLGIIVLGLALLTFVLLVGSWVRRQGRPRRAGGQGTLASSYIPAVADAEEENEAASDDEEAIDEPPPEIDDSGRDTAGGDSFGWKETVAGD